MATPAATITTVERELGTLTLLLGDLPSVAEEWEGLSAAERAAWSLDWDQAMGVVQAVLAPAYQAGRMTDAQAVRYREWWRQVNAALPTIQWLHLRRPPMALAPG